MIFPNWRVSCSFINLEESRKS